MSITIVIRLARLPVLFSILRLLKGLYIGSRWRSHTRALPAPALYLTMEKGSEVGTNLSPPIWIRFAGGAGIECDTAWPLITGVRLVLSSLFENIFHLIDGDLLALDDIRNMGMSSWM